MGYTKKLYEEMVQNCEAVVLHDEYGAPQVMPKNWIEIGSFEEYTVYRKKQNDITSKSNGNS